MKGNQKELYEPIVDTFEMEDSGLNPAVYDHDINGDHGRIQNRKVECLPVSIIKTQLDLKKWSGIQSIVKVAYTNHSNGSIENRYFISTLPYEEAERIALGIRSHWQIENNRHWVLDVSFREDSSRIKNENAALNFSWFRKMALSLLNQDDRKLSNRKKMLRNWANPEKIMETLNDQ